jgi:hypothetical protein
MEDLFKSLISSAIEDEVLETVVDFVSPEAVVSEIATEEIALGLFDLALSTGFAEAAVVLAGGPVALVMGVKMLKKYRAKQKEKNEG